MRIFIFLFLISFAVMDEYQKNVSILLPGVTIIKNLFNK